MTKPHNNNNIRGVFVGSGSDGLNEPIICETILSLAKKQNQKLSSSNGDDIRVLYLGTATYDLSQPKERQTMQFRQAGCTITELSLSSSSSSSSHDDDHMREMVDNAHVILASGGNTLFAIDRWNKTGLDVHLHRAMMSDDKNVVFAGGSAGAICWFDGGHSDSMDPDSYRDAMISSCCDDADESSEAPKNIKDAKSWEYIRVDGLGWLPGLCCPHHDRIQSNGVRRSVDFDEMLSSRHSGEVGICIDHWAALVLDGEDYEVVSVDGKPGSVVVEEGKERFCVDNSGVPGVWRKRVVEGKVMVDYVGKSGKVSDLFVEAESIVKDPRVDQCRLENPSD